MNAQGQRKAKPRPGFDGAAASATVRYFREKDLIRERAERLKYSVLIGAASLDADVSKALDNKKISNTLRRVVEQMRKDPEQWDTVARHFSLSDSKFKDLSETEKITAMTNELKDKMAAILSQELLQGVVFQSTIRRQRQDDAHTLSTIYGAWQRGFDKASIEKLARARGLNKEELDGVIQFMEKNKRNLGMHIGPDGMKTVLRDMFFDHINSGYKSILKDERSKTRDAFRKIFDVFGDEKEYVLGCVMPAIGASLRGITGDPEMLDSLTLELHKSTDRYIENVKDSSAAMGFDAYISRSLEEIKQQIQDLQKQIFEMMANTRGTPGNFENAKDSQGQEAEQKDTPSAEAPAGEKEAAAPGNAPGNIVRGTVVDIQEQGGRTIVQFDLAEDSPFGKAKERISLHPSLISKNMTAQKITDELKQIYGAGSEVALRITTNNKSGDALRLYIDDIAEVAPEQGAGPQL